MGTAVIYGRSDSMRMGSSEIYRAVLAVPEVVDALVIDLPREGTDGWMPLFVVLRDGVSLSGELIAEIRKRVREDCSPRPVPSEIRQITAVPHTLSGKVLEVPVKRILTGTPADQAAARSCWPIRRPWTAAWSSPPTTGDVRLTRLVNERPRDLADLNETRHGSRRMGDIRAQPAEAQARSPRRNESIRESADRRPCDRSCFAIPTAISSARPLKRSGIHTGAPASCSPLTPVART